MWTISTFSGLKANGLDSNWRIGMFELCRAVNERQFGIKTQFYKGDGTQGSDLTYADLLGLHVAGAAKINLQRIQEAIVVLCLGFTETSGGDDFWTVAALEAAIGTDLTLAPESATDSRFWQAQKDALDRLLYTQAEGASSYVSGAAEGSRSYFQDAAFFPNTEAQAWDDIGYNSGPSGIGPFTGWTMRGPGSSFHIYVAGACDSCIASFSLSPTIPASPLKIKYTVREENNTRISPGVDPIEPGYHVGTAAGTLLEVAGPVGTSRTVVLETTTNDFAGGNEAEISMDGGRPATNPIPGYPSPGGINIFNGPSVVRATVDSAKVYYDLSSILSDQ